MNVTFSHYEDIAEGVKTLWFKPERPVRYQAGQYTELYLPHDNPDDRGLRRWFTLSSSPTEPLLAITTSFRRADGSSYKKILNNITPGAQLKLAEPLGDFVLPKDKTIPLLFVAAGLGVTPVYSIVKYLADSGEDRNIHMVHASSTHGQFVFGPLFKDRFISYRQLQKPDLKAGLVLQAANNLGPRTLVYISGPELMVEQLNAELQTLGIAPSQVLTDFFHGYKWPTAN